MDLVLLDSQVLLGVWLGSFIPSPTYSWISVGESSSTGALVKVQLQGKDVSPLETLILEDK